MRARKGFIMLMSLLFLIVCSGNVWAQGSLSITTDQTEIGTQQQVTVKVQALDENQTPLMGEMKVLVRISKGGLLDTRILKEGLTLKDGFGEFVYIAPSKAGNADLLIIDANTNLSARLTLKVLEAEKVQVEWKKEFARITKVKGKVAFKRAGEESWNSVLKDIELHEGDSIRTWDKSVVTMELFDGSEVTLEPWTTLYIKFLQSSIANAEVKQSVFKVYTGNVLCKVKKYVEKGSRFEIETESTAAGIRGTVFELIVSMEGTTELIVYDGSVIFESIPQEMLFMVSGGQRVALAPEFEIPEVIEHNVTPEEREQAVSNELSAEEGTIDEEGATEEPVEETPEEPVEEPVVEEPTVKEPYETPTEPIVEIPVTTPGEDPAITIPVDPATNPEKEFENIFWKLVKPYKTNLNFGSQLLDEKIYFAFNIQPEFKKFFGTGLSFGLNLAIYQDPITGQVRLGSPDEDVKFANIINWLEYDGKYTYFRYSDLRNITYGYGLMMGEYSKAGAKGFQLGLNNITAAKLGCRVLLPFDVKSIYPWQTEETSSLYAARATTQLKFLGLPVQFGVTGVTDTNDALKTLPGIEVPSLGLGADVSLPGFAALEPYGELVTLLPYGTGAEAGIRGSLFSRFWYQTGYRVMGEGFYPNYFGDDYEISKKNSLDMQAGLAVTGRTLPNLMDLETYVPASGAYAKVGVNLGLAQLRVGYENYAEREAYAPVLSADLVASTPQILSLPSISAGFTYKQYQFNKYRQDVDRFFNKNTNFNWFITCPLGSGLSLNFINRFIPSDTEVKYTRELTITVPF